MNKLLSLAAVMMVAVLLVSTGFSQEKRKATIGQPAPLFSLQDQTGKVVSLKDFAGKIVVLEWFNEDCPVVQRHYKADTQNSLYNKYKDKGVAWLAINTTSGKTNETNAKAAAMWHIDRPILNDSTGQVGHAYGATNTPGMFVIDKNGMLAYSGAIDDNASGSKTSGIKNYVSQALDELLADKPVSEPLTQQYGCTVKYKD